MWYTTKVGLDMEIKTRELSAHTSRPDPEHWKALERLIGYLKGKETKVIFIRNPKVIKSVMFLNSN